VGPVVEVPIYKTLSLRDLSRLRRSSWSLFVLGTTASPTEWFDVFSAQLLIVCGNRRVRLALGNPRRRGLRERLLPQVSDERAGRIGSAHARERRLGAAWLVLSAPVPGTVFRRAHSAAPAHGARLNRQSISINSTGNRLNRHNRNYLQDTNRKLEGLVMQVDRGNRSAACVLSQAAVAGAAAASHKGTPGVSKHQIVMAARSRYRAGACTRPSRRPQRGVFAYVNGKGGVLNRQDQATSPRRPVQPAQTVGVKKPSGAGPTFCHLGGKDKKKECEHIHRLQSLSIPSFLPFPIRSFSLTSFFIITHLFQLSPSTPLSFMIRLSALSPPIYSLRPQPPLSSL